MIGASVLAACSGKSHASLAPGSSGGSGAPSGGPPQTTVLDGPAVDVSARFDDHALQTAQSFAGSWLGAWVDDAGGSGNLDVVGAVDEGARTATVTARVTGNLLGGPPPADTTYVVHLDAFAANADSWSAKTPQFGNATYDTSTQVITFSDVPGQPGIDSVAVETQLHPAAATMAITVHPKSGTASRTAIAFSRSGTRPATPSLGAVTSATDFVHGGYAAGLVTTDELAATFGRPSQAPEPNGGNAIFGPGLQTSNAAGHSQDGQEFAQWTIYRATDANAARNYFELNASISDPVAGLGDAAQVFSSGLATLQVLKGTEVLELTVGDTAGSLTVDQRKSMQQQLAAAMVPRMTGS
jgi:hypothetical protein